MTRQLYHYTCQHGWLGIGQSGSVTPPRVHHPASFAGQTDPLVVALAQLSWFTDLDVPHRAALGLTMHETICDRIRHRYIVLDSGGILPWISSPWRLGPARALERQPGSMLLHWYVATVPVSVLADDEYEAMFSRAGPIRS